MQRRTEPGVYVFRTVVCLYVVCLPVYFYYRFRHTIDGRWYQSLVCVLELYGALNVLLLGVIRYRRPWAPASPMPPQLLDEDVEDGGGANGLFDVSILVPCCNEPDDVVFGTVRAALALSHPLARSVRVVLCDDGGFERRRQKVSRLGARAVYVSRPKDPSVPRHGKAGNLNHALRHVLYPDGAPPADACVVVFDCDMEAHGDFLAATLPYLASDSATALVQTPQFFYNVVPEGDIFNHHNLTFFQAMQPGLDAWGATVCCGTNFVARASALWQVGYFPTESITEDFVLSVKLATAGHRVRFHAAVVCTGEAPEDLKQIFKQRRRWCCGCWQIFFHPATPRMMHELARRRGLLVALLYCNAPLSYLANLLTVPLWAVVPTFSLYADVHPVEARASASNPRHLAQGFLATSA